MTEHDADAAGEQRRQRVDARIRPGGHHRQAERPVELPQRRVVGEIGLGEAEYRLQATVVGRDQASVDQPGARWWVGEGTDNDEPVGVGDDRAFQGIGVVGGATQHASAFAPPDDPGKAAGRTRDVTDQGDLVADDHAGPAQRTAADTGDQHAGGCRWAGRRPGRRCLRSQVPGDMAGVATPINGDDRGRHRVGMVGTFPGSGP